MCVWCDNEGSAEKSQGLKMLRAYLSVCLHYDINSFGLFREAKVGLQIIKYFSQKHNLHLFEVGLYGAACFTIFHLTLNIVKFSFNLAWCYASCLS